MLAAAASPEQLFLDYLRKGDRRAVQRLLEAEMPRAWRLARRILPSDQDAEDAVQDALLRLHRDARRYDGRVPFRAWLARLIQLAAVDRLRVLRRQRERELPMADESHAPRSQDPAYAVQAAELGEILHDLLDRLPERYREPIALVHLAELPHAEVARALGLKASALSMRLRRGCERLAGMAREAGLALSVPALEICLGQLPVTAPPAGLASASAASSGSSVMAVAAVGASGAPGAASWVAVALALTVLGGGAALWWSNARSAAVDDFSGPPALVEPAPPPAHAVDIPPASKPIESSAKSWDFAQGPVDGFEVVRGSWRWDDRADALGAGMRIDGGAWILLPTELPSRPFVLEAEGFQTAVAPEASVFGVRWVRDDGIMPPFRSWSPGLADLQPGRRSLLQVYFDGAHALTVAEGGSVFSAAEYRNDYPGRRIMLLMARMHLKEIGVRELLPDEIPAHLRNARKLVRRWKVQPIEVPEEALRDRP